ncbi:MAG: mismatch repair protein MutT [Bacteroidetes bacterium]|nr:mismatch repair protein MutT [Bacteroidota bacterium]
MVCRIRQLQWGLLFIFIVLMITRFIIFFLLITVVEVYFLQAVKTFSQDFSPGKKSAILYIAYGLALLNIGLAVIAMFYPPPNWNNFFRFMSAIGLIFFVCKLLGCSFLIIDDVIRLFRWVFSWFQPKQTEAIEAGTKISRLKFMSQLAITFTVIPAVGFLYGMVRGAYKYRVHKVKVPSQNLPDAFNGYKIVQISDIHTGSFLDNNALTRAFDIVMKQGADLILFTGDLVNNEAKETIGFENVYNKLKAPHGVFSVLGNHDYGDYVQWDSPEAKRKNLESLKSVHGSAGWRLLMNEHVELERNGQKIALLGIENWGGNMHFPKYGRMDLAYKGAAGYPYKILMSHDPSHWEKQVQPEYKDIDLTLSGHTHGMQFGIEIPGLIKWSPVKYFYKQWAGLYKQDNQFLYVNRGLGFLGYPGRLGIWPEITVIELQKV